MSAAAKNIDKRISGIRGWLVLPAIGMIISPIFGVISFIFESKTFAEMVNYGFAAYVFTQYILNTAILIYGCIAAVRFFKKQKDAPITIIKLLIARVITSLVIFIVGAVTMGVNTKIILSLLKTNNFMAFAVAAIIWVNYFKKSKRVEATFVN